MDEAVVEADKFRAVEELAEERVVILSGPRSGSLPGVSSFSAHAGPNGLTLSILDDVSKKRGVQVQVEVPRDVIIALARAIVDDALEEE